MKKLLARLPWLARKLKLMATVQDLITSTAQQYGLDPRLALAVAQAESNFDQSAVSGAGAVGVFQLEPATAADLGVNPSDLVENIDGGVRYLQQMLASFGGNVDQALGAYNWGPGNMASALAQYGADWLSHAPAETQAYVPRVLSYMGAAAAGAESILSNPVVIVLLVLGLALIL